MVYDIVLPCLTHITGKIWTVTSPPLGHSDDLHLFQGAPSLNGKTFYPTCSITWAIYIDLPAPTRMDHFGRTILHPLPSHPRRLTLRHKCLVPRGDDGLSPEGISTEPRTEDEHCRMRTTPMLRLFPLQYASMIFNDHPGVQML